jgi:CBS domain-containing protein
MPGMSAAPRVTVGSVAQAIDTVKVGEPTRRVLDLLAEKGVAILLDEKSAPVGILTWCDDPATVREVVRDLLAKNAGRAEKVFQALHRFGPSVVDTVREDESLSAVAERLVQLGRKTGITVVDARGAFRGYAFAADVNERLKSAVRDREAELQREFRDISARYPDVARRIEQRLTEL